MGSTYQKLMNEYMNGGSKSMIDFVDHYLDEYDDSFKGFVTYLYDIEGRIGPEQYQDLIERIDTAQEAV